MVPRGPRKLRPILNGLVCSDRYWCNYVCVWSFSKWPIAFHIWQKLTHTAVSGQVYRLEASNCVTSHVPRYFAGTHIVRRKNRHSCAGFELEYLLPSGTCFIYHYRGFMTRSTRDGTIAVYHCNGHRLSRHTSQVLLPKCVVPGIPCPTPANTELHLFLMPQSKWRYTFWINQPSVGAYQVRHGFRTILDWGQPSSVVGQVCP